MRILRFDEQIMSIRIMFRADVRPPPVGSFDIDHCTDFEVAVRHAPERAVGGHGAKRHDFRRLAKQIFPVTNPSLRGMCLAQIEMSVNSPI